MRVYVPATLEFLKVLSAEGEFSPVSRTAFAVTPTLREAYFSGDDEELSEVHIMPSVFNPEVSRRVAIAVEAAARAEGVARN